MFKIRIVFFHTTVISPARIGAGNFVSKLRIASDLIIIIIMQKTKPRSMHTFMYC